MDGAPRVARTPLELLENSHNVEPGLLNKYWGPFICGTAGFLTVILANFATKRPLFSSIHKHILSTAAGVGIGFISENYREKYYADRDAVLRHYVQLHPEDFPAFERKQYKNVLEKWYPVR